MWRSYVNLLINIDCVYAQIFKKCFVRIINLVRSFLFVSQQKKKIK